MITRLLLSGVFLLTFFTGFCQPAQNLKNEAAVNSLYNNKLQASSNLYSGPQYIEQIYQKIGSPFFLSDTLINGWISYDSHLYLNVPLQWDVLQNYVITSSLNNSAKLVLRNELIDSFYFSGHHVKQIDADKEHNLLQGGLYDVLYGGNTAVIAKRKKVNMVVIQGLDIYYNFSNQDRIYIKKEGIYYLVNMRKDVFRLFRNKTVAINRLVRKEGLSWKKDFDKCVAVAAEYNDNSTH